MRMSESVANLSAALAAFQGEIRNPANTAHNPFFKSKYAPLPDILNLVRPVMARHGLALLQMPSADGDEVQVHQVLLHCSGEWIATPPVVARAEKATAQGAGSAITYLRRYGLSAVLGISSEDDDDGNQASEKQAACPEGPGKDAASNAITDAQMKKIHALARELNLSHDDLSKGAQQVFKVDSLTELTRVDATKMIDRLKVKLDEARVEAGLAGARS